METTHNRICKLCKNPYTNCSRIAVFCYAKEDHVRGICVSCYVELKCKRMSICDGCEKPRRDVRSIGRDSNGAADGPDYCFLCRIESAHGKVFDVKKNKYVASF